MDIAELFDPSIKCDETLYVNINKKEGVVVMIVGLCVILFMFYLTIAFKGPKVGFFVLALMGLIFAGAWHGITTTQNPVLTIDKYGVTFDGQFHTWEDIECIKVKLGDSESSDDIFFHLKNNTSVKFNVCPFLEQKLNVIATYLVKYFKQR